MDNSFFTILSHTGDIKIKIEGKSFQELLTHALYAMFAVCEPNIIDAPMSERHFEIGGTAPALLLINFLSEALYLSDSFNEVYYQVRFDQMHLSNVSGAFIGIPISGFARSEIKAVTYHDLMVEERNGAWYAQIVFDV